MKSAGNVLKTPGLRAFKCLFRFLLLILCCESSSLSISLHLKHCRGGRDMVAVVCSKGVGSSCNVTDRKSKSGGREARVDVEVTVWYVTVKSIVNVCLKYLLCCR